MGNSSFKFSIQLSHLHDIAGIPRYGMHLELLQAWTGRIVRARYQQSILGGLWAIIQPASAVAIFTVVFTRFVKVDTGGVPYVLFSYATLVPWTLFSNCLNDMVSSLVDNMGLVTKIYFPREILPTAAMLARLLDFGIATGILAILMVFFRMPLFQASWLFLPVILAVQVALTLGLGLLGAALNVFFRDVKHLFTLGLQIWLYASPVIYPVSSVPEQWRFFYFLNPMAGVVEAYREVLLFNRLPNSSLLWSAFLAAAVLILGFRFFKSVEFQFADVV
jgi:lipopolysaccharide transport system permease protein